MLWQGEEFAENYFLPDFGAGRVALLRPLRWDYFYDDAGQAIVAWSESCCASGGARSTSGAGPTSSSTTGTGISRAGC